MPIPTTTSTTSTGSTRSPTSSHSRSMISILTCVGASIGGNVLGRLYADIRCEQPFDAVPQRRQHTGAVTSRA